MRTVPRACHSTCVLTPRTHPANADSTLSDTRVRIYGNMAHVKSMSLIRNRPRNPGQTGKADPSPLLVVHVLVKDPQGWHFVSRQATRPTPPPSATTATP